MHLSSLRARIALALIAALAAGVGLWLAWAEWLSHWASPWRELAGALAGLAGLLLALGLAALLVAPLNRLLRALDLAALSYRDGDFSVALRSVGNDELGALVRRHAELGAALREQRQHLAQRELLLDTVVQHTPVALLLVDNHARIVYANLAARHLLGPGRSLEGGDFDAWLAAAPPALRDAVNAGADALFGVTLDGAEETFHHSQRSFRLQGREHRLHLLRRMTREFSRQEVATWKRVIRIISHELNNSLAPISSLAHSGAAFARRGDIERLPAALATIGERARHLHRFLDGYAQFAKLPTPSLEDVDLAAFVRQLSAHGRFRLAQPVPEAAARFDAAQVEQALINLLKNAHEAQGPADEVTLEVRFAAAQLRFEVCDRGVGMSEAVLAQALLPLFSTKRGAAGGGSGLGLALVREIAEAHGGHVSLANRRHGGVRVVMTLAR